MIDLHSHILPNIDDGANSWDEAIEMARFAHKDGITDIVATPHTHDGIYINKREDVLDALNTFKNKLIQESIDIQIHPASEIHIHLELINNLHSGQILTMLDGNKYAMVELPVYYFPTFTDNVLYELTMCGITPIICHPERNAYLQENAQRIVNWIYNGVIIQVTAGSIMGLMGKRAQQFATYMIKNNLAHVIASDAHNMSNRRPELRNAYSYLQHHKKGTRELFHKNAEFILRGEACIVPEPLAPRNIRRFFFWRNTPHERR